MKLYIAALLLTCSVQAFSQEKPQVSLVPPFDFPLTLSGNFGEIRQITFTVGSI